MKALLWVFKVIVGIPLVYYSSIADLHYMFHESWETAYKIAPMCTIGAGFMFLIVYAIKKGA